MEDKEGNHIIALKNAQHPGVKRELLEPAVYPTDSSITAEQISEGDQFMASIQAHMVMPGLVVGSENNCKKAIEQGFTCFSVRHIPCENPKCHHIPYLDMATFLAKPEQLSSGANYIYDTWAKKGEKVYLHCFHGIERAPLMAAYMIKRHVLPGLPFNNVYRWVLSRRHFSQDRRHWLPETVQKELGGIWPPQRTSPKP